MPRNSGQIGRVSQPRFIGTPKVPEMRQLLAESPGILAVLGEKRTKRELTKTGGLDGVF